MDVIDRLVAELALPPAAGPAHGLLVALPASLLVLAALAELFKSDGLGWRPGRVARVAMILGALTCLPAVATGVTQALDRELVGEALERHRLAGLSLTGLAWGAWLMGWIAGAGTRPRATGAYRILLLAAGLLAAGQLWWGAALAHGTERFESARRPPRLVSSPVEPSPDEAAPAPAEPVETAPTAGAGTLTAGSAAPVLAAPAQDVPADGAATPGAASPSAGPAPSLTAGQRDLLAALRDAGALAGPVAQDGPAVEVDLGRLGPAADDDLVARLEPLAPVLLWLDLGGSAVSGAGLESVGRLTALERLDLSRTGLVDDDLAALAPLAALVVLNLHGTALGDGALEHLATLPSLRRVYLWDTAVSAAGLAALEARRPDLTVVLGGSLPAASEG